MKVAKIRGIESYGMICAEDEIGLSDNHAGIYILNDEAQTGDAVSKYFNVYTDWIYEIGLNAKPDGCNEPYRCCERCLCVAYLSSQ